MNTEWQHIIVWLIILRNSLKSVGPSPEVPCQECMHGSGVLTQISKCNGSKSNRILPNNFCCGWPNIQAYVHCQWFLWQKLKTITEIMKH